MIDITYLKDVWFYYNNNFLDADGNRTSVALMKIVKLTARLCFRKLRHVYVTCIKGAKLKIFANIP